MKKILLLLFLLSICLVSLAAKKTHDNGPADIVKTTFK